MALASLAGAVPEPARAITWGGVSVPFGYQSWLAKTGGTTTRVSQLYFPIVVTTGLGPHADLVLSTSLAGSGAEREGQPANSLDGASAFTAQVFLRLAGDRLLVQAGIIPPSGRWGLDAEEMAVSQAIGLPVLGFGLKQYGSGLQRGGAATIAFPFSPTANFTVGVGGIHRGKYRLQEGGGDYSPASEWALTSGLDLGTPDPGGAGQPVHLDATYRLFGEDEVDGARAFAEGDQVELQVEGRTGGAAMRSHGFARVVLKGENTVFSSVGATVSSLKASSGDGYFARLGFDRPLRSGLRGGADLEWNHVTGSDTFGRNGTAYGIGPALISPLGRGGATLELRGMFQWGVIEGTSGGPDSDLSGFSIFANFRWRPPS
jgi:hypothetical protein